MGEYKKLLEQYRLSLIDINELLEDRESEMYNKIALKEELKKEESNLLKEISDVRNDLSYLESKRNIQLNAVRKGFLLALKAMAVIMVLFYRDYSFASFRLIDFGVFASTLSLIAPYYIKDMIKYNKIAKQNTVEGLTRKLAEKEVQKELVDKKIKRIEQDVYGLRYELFGGNKAKVNILCMINNLEQEINQKLFEKKHQVVKEEPKEEVVQEEIVYSESTLTEDAPKVLTRKPLKNR